MTVAVVDAYDLPTAETDLAAYRSFYGLPPCTTANGCFRKVDQNGGTSYPPTAVGRGWDGEIALDIDMVSAACPNCHILLVEAASDSLDNLGAAVNTAVTLGAIAVSNSYGGQDSSSDAYLDASYYDHPGVAITASTGDCGYDCNGSVHQHAQGVEYPAASPYVIAVGGTSLTRDSSTRGWAESAWGNADGGPGSGCSAYETKPTWQVDTGCGSYRTQADVSAVADPQTGVAVYSNGTWYEYGGTSAASPIIAATFALGGGPAAGVNPASYLYLHVTSTTLNDVTSGSNGTYYTCPGGYPYLCNGEAGYDGPTGLGTPNGTSAFAAPTVPGKPANLVAVAGNGTASLTWTAPDDGGSPITAYTVNETQPSAGSVTCPGTGTSCTVSGLTNGTAYTFTVTATNGKGSGAASDPATVATVPGKPTAVTATAGVAAATVSWTAAADGGSAITGYLVTSAPDGKTCSTSGALSCTVSGLTNGTAYTFTVTATNGIGTGPASDPSNSVTPEPAPTVPGKPTGVTATGGLGSASVSWTAPADNGGSAITGYTVTGAPGGSTCATSGALSCTVSGLTDGTYTFTVTAANGLGTGPASDPSAAAAVFSGATFHAITPGRVLDSRINQGAVLFHSRTKQTFAVAGLDGVPAGAVAVTGNVTIVGQTRNGYVTVAPSLTSGTQPGTSTINFPTADVRANGITVSLGSGGKLDAMYWSASTADTVNVIFDVTGYFANDTSGATFHAITPGRVLDSRINQGAVLFHSRTKQTFAVAGLDGVPAGAVAVTGNVTIVGQTRNGYVTVAPSLTSGTQPGTSTINFPTADVRANGITVSLGSGGKLDAMYWSASTADTVNVIFDVTGYFAN
jgi:hypothetical protein